MTSESLDSLDFESPLRVNAWSGNGSIEGSLFRDKAKAWANRSMLAAAHDKIFEPLAFAPLELANWRDGRVGWGIVVPDNSSMSDAEKARGIDLPVPLRELVAARGGAPVLRWRPGLESGRLRRYYTDRQAADLLLSGERGTGVLAVPRYLMIAASPEEIPWNVQYRLQLEAYVGRVSLDPDALGRYVGALLNEWDESQAQRSRPIVWAVDHGHPDITRLMRVTLADRIAGALAADPEHEFLMEGGHLADAGATGPDLVAALKQRRPAFVMTSSHGATFPLDDASAMRAHIGVPLDVGHALLDLGEIRQWNPDGCIWYAHACCSAGTSAKSEFAEILSGQGNISRMLNAVAGVGNAVAPLPQALLSAQSPARAFVGHIEPTFDWTLRDTTGQNLGASLQYAFVELLHNTTRTPIGLALDGYFRAVGALLLDHLAAITAVNEFKPGAAERAVRTKLVAMDRASMVILGDPTVRLPAAAQPLAAI